MPARHRIDRPTKLTTTIPESDYATLSAMLYSPVEGRVPKGSYSQWISERVREQNSWRKLDLHPFGFPPGYFITGPKDFVDALTRKLETV